MPLTKPSVTVIILALLCCSSRSVVAFSPAQSISTHRDAAAAPSRRTIPTTPVIGRERRITTNNYIRLHSTTDNGIDLDTTRADEARRVALAKKRSQRPSSSQSSSSSDKSQQSTDRNTKNDEEWKFFDTARLHVTAGPGGNGCVAFRREKGEAMGGPNGGRGGSGGEVRFVADESLNTLAGLRSKIHVKARGGKNGIGKNKDGACGKDA
eukprot:CAMPEP_0181123022 /NCGR_PEP_ID=MMETSP1071-20121207/25645_1 /TAXON_ID=35127 /ORGANISM="Thalassiosira sp., Strain NH16" /LENGTH=209 /DNA_ID=CAMNT_0023208071 /DNA_START=25 /DNA_END=651 /DNA_ORIENTATION=-